MSNTIQDCTDIVSKIGHIRLIHTFRINDDKLVPEYLSVSVNDSIVLIPQEWLKRSIRSIVETLESNYEAA